MAQIPHGPKALKCPLWQKSMATVCHTCPLWTQLRGVDVNTGKEIEDEWNCGLAMLPGLLINVAQKVRETSASIDRFNDDMVKANRVALSFNGEQPLQLKKD